MRNDAIANDRGKSSLKAGLLQSFRTKNFLTLPTEKSNRPKLHIDQRRDCFAPVSAIQQLISDAQMRPLIQLSPNVRHRALPDIVAESLINCLNIPAERPKYPRSTLAANPEGDEAGVTCRTIGGHLPPYQPFRRVDDAVVRQ